MNKSKLSLLILLGVLGATGCGTHMIVATGTTIGMKATPGDTQTQPPQLTVGYRRAEAITTPTSTNGASATDASGRGTDTFSSVTAVSYKTGLTTKTSLKQVIATGFAAEVAATNPAFIDAAKEIGAPKK